MEASNPRLNKLPMIVIAALVAAIGIVCVLIGYTEATTWQRALVTAAIIAWAAAAAVVVHYFYRSQYLDEDQSAKWRVLRKVIPGLAGVGLLLVIVFYVAGLENFVPIGILLVWLAVLTFAVGVMGTRGPHARKTTYGPAPRREGEDLEFELGNSLIFGLVKPGGDTGMQQAITDDSTRPETYRPAPAQPVSRFEEDPRNWADGRPPESMRDLYRQPADGRPPVPGPREQPRALEETQYTPPPAQNPPPSAFQPPRSAPSAPRVGSVEPRGPRPQTPDARPVGRTSAPRVGSVEPVSRPSGPPPATRPREGQAPSGSRPSGAEFHDPRWGEQAPPAENLDWLYSSEPKSATGGAPTSTPRTSAPTPRPSVPGDNVESRRRPPVEAADNPYARGASSRTSAPQPGSRPPAGTQRPAGPPPRVDSAPSAPNRRPAFPGEDGAPTSGPREQVRDADFRPQERRRPPIVEDNRSYGPVDSAQGPSTTSPPPGRERPQAPHPAPEDQPVFRVVRDAPTRASSTTPNTPPPSTPGKPRRAMPAD